MASDTAMTMQTDREICALICRSNGIKAKDIARMLDIERQKVNHILYSSPLMKELCWQDREYNWHGIMKQARPHVGLQEFAGYYDTARNFIGLEEKEWLEQLKEGCTNIGRNLNDTRGLFHSFMDCRQQMIRLFSDLREMMGERCLDWEIAFELRLKQSRSVRIYADVLVITEDKVFSLEFKMKNEVNPEEILQAAKYCPYLEIMFGPDYEVIPVLILTLSREAFDFAPIGKTDAVLPVCSGDMLFNIFDEYLGFLA
ncbi:MAG: hypothetical protein IKP86_05945 [Anaerolineaceae bacterium]|nr:hypothetical protein [Anaerolineaceae bacterium]